MKKEKRKKTDLKSLRYEHVEEIEISRRIIERIIKAKNTNLGQVVDARKGEAKSQQKLYLMNETNMD